MGAQLAIELPKDVSAPSRARAALDELREEIEPSRFADARVLVSELVTNAVKYGGDGAIRLELSTDGRLIRGEIIDQGSGFSPVARGNDPDRVGGWGLHLVDHLSERWGTHEGSTHVWFEVSQAPKAERALGERDRMGTDALGNLSDSR